MGWPMGGEIAAEAADHVPDALDGDSARIAGVLGDHGHGGPMTLELHGSFGRR